MKIKKLDELQYIKRGNIFKHCLFAIIGLLLLYIALIEFDIVFISQRNALLLIIIFIVSLFCIEMICYGIYPLSERRQKFIYILSGLLGLAIVIISICEMIFGKESFIENEILSDTGAGVIMGCLLFSIFLAYVIKSICNNKTERSFEK